VKVTTEHTPECNAVITVEVDDEQLRKALQTVAQQVSRTRQIRGFRPGRAPYAIVGRTVGKELLLDQAINDLAESIYKQVLETEKIEPYDAGALDVAQREPLILKYTIPLRPSVTLGDYRSIHLHPKPVEVSDEEVNRALERMQKEQEEMETVTRPVQMGDLVTINVKGGLPERDLLDRQGMQIRVEEKPVFPWLVQLVGTNLNETRTLTYTYPADAIADLAGQTASYAVTVTDIKESRLPALDDEFARSVSSFETLAQLKMKIRSDLYAQKEVEENNRFTDEVVDAVVEQSQIAFPASMLEDEINREMEESKAIAQRLSMTWEKYLQLAGKGEAAFREGLRPRAEKHLKRFLTLVEFGDAENIQVTGKEVDVAIDLQAQMAERSGQRADETRRALSTAESRRDIEFRLKIQKTLDYIVAMVKGEPTSGKIVTPEMVLREQYEQRERELAAQAEQATPPPGGLITDPAQVSGKAWPLLLPRPAKPGEER
jgi:trigger factor